MSISMRKDRVRLVCLWTLPDEFVAGIKSATDGQKSATDMQFGGLLGAYLAIPSVQRNTLKFEITLANSDFEQTAQAIGLQKSPLNAMVVIEAESVDKINEFVADPAFQKVFQGATGNNAFQPGGTVTFSGDVLSVIDK